MTQDQKNLEIALEELELSRLENKHLKSKIKRLSDQIYQLENPIIKTDTPLNIDHILSESEKAMNRFSEKLRKENAKYAKQKQSKG